MDNREVILSVEKLDTSFCSDKRMVRIVEDVSFRPRREKTLAVVDESDCGKSVTVNSIIRFMGRNAIVEAKSIRYNTLKDRKIKEYHLESIKEPSGSEMRSLRGPDTFIVLQDPMSSLNPIYKVGNQVAEGLLQRNKGMTKQQTREKVLEMFRGLGIPGPEGRTGCFPYQFSGGMKQKVMIAIAMICNPKLVICDKPTTTLDVTIRTQIMELSKELWVKDSRSIVLITHNMGLMAETADEVRVMYMGRVVGFGSLENVSDRTSHPYTKTLLCNVPVLRLAGGQKLETIPGATPNPSNLKEGCEFADRYPGYTENCHKGVILAYEVGPSHHVRYLKYRSCPEVEQMNENREVIFKVENSQTQFPITRGIFKKMVGHVKAVDSVSLKVYKREILGIVDEFSCRKSTFGKTVMMLGRPTSGRVLFNFDDELKDITQFSRKGMFSFHRKIQMVFQDPYSTLNPQEKIYSSFEEPLKIYGIGALKEWEEVIQKVLKMVDIQPDYLMRYPHEFSSGQRQRLCTARALEVVSEVLIRDEPVLALDVSIQARVLNTMKEIQEEMKLTYLFIARDLSVVRYMPDRIMVMYLGRIVRAADSRALCGGLLRPYTQTLLSTIPVADIHKTKEHQVLEDEMPSPVHKPDGCPFHNRCPKCMGICKTRPPVMMHRGARGHTVAYHLYDGEGK